MLLWLKHQTSCIWVSYPSRHRMKYVLLEPPPPYLEGRQMDPTGLRRVMSLERLHILEWAGQVHKIYIVTKLILKLGGKIRILGAKIFLWVDHLWTRILLVQTQPMKNVTNWLDFCQDKNARPYATDTTDRFSNTTNGFIKAKKGKMHVLADLESDPLSSDSSLN